MPITRQANVHYPIDILDIGDSFFIPALSAREHMHKLHSLARQLDITIDYRTGIDKATGMYGIRVFRIT